MLIVDRREDTLGLFKPFDVEVESAELDSADYCFIGNGADADRPLLIGIERKKIRDLINSMRDRRLSGSQAPDMAMTYDRRYLVIEGIWGTGKTGAIEELCGREWRSLTGSKRAPVLAREVDSFLSSMEEFFGFNIWKTRNAWETVAWIVSKYKYWSKPYADHHTHEQIYAPVPDGAGRRMRFVSLEEQIRRELGEAGVLCWRMAAQIPGIDRRAEAVAREFKHSGKLHEATVKELMRVEGIGKIIAKRAVELMNGY